MISELKRAEDDFCRCFLLDKVSHLCAQTGRSSHGGSGTFTPCSPVYSLHHSLAARRDDFISAAIMSDIYWW